MKEFFEVYDEMMEATGTSKHHLAEHGLSQEALDPVIGEFCVLSGIPYQSLAPIILLTVQLGMDWEREVSAEARAMLGEMKL